jgi:hypothetical protein
MMDSRLALLAAIGGLLAACSTSGGTNTPDGTPHDSGLVEGGTGGSSGAGSSGAGSSGAGSSGAGSSGGSSSGGDGGGGHAIKTVFLILLENHNWSDIKGSSSAPYINGMLLPESSYATQYFNPPLIHPSEPNYLWLEAGKNFGILNDSNPSSNHQSTTQHLATLLKNAGISWRAYQEDISGTVCPLTGVNMYAPKHDPFVFFDDSTGANDAGDAYCIAHNRRYSELTNDLKNGTVARYNFLTPNLCNDMHDTCPPLSDSIAQGDTWLSNEVPKIMASSAYKDGGALFITWDEGEGSDGPIGMIVASPLAKGGGYSNSLHYTHSSTLRTMQEIFGVTPMLGDAANATDLSDLFSTYP